MRGFGLCGLLLTLVGTAAATEPLFISDSRRFGESKMDIVVREVERLPRASRLDIRIKAVGSSVGSSFFLLCSVRELARLRGGFRYIRLIENAAGGTMLVGFLKHSGEPAAALGAAFATAGDKASEIDLDQFAPICDLSFPPGK